MSASIKVAGDVFNQSVMSYVRKTHSLFIGEDSAEAIKIKIGTANEEADIRTMEVNGRNVITGLPKVATLTSEEIRVALKDATNQIVEAVHGVLKRHSGAGRRYCGQGNCTDRRRALLHGMDTLIEQRTGVNTLTVQDAMDVVAVGTGRYAEVMTKMDSYEGAAYRSTFCAETGGSYG